MEDKKCYKAFGKVAKESIDDLYTVAPVQGYSIINTLTG